MKEAWHLFNIRRALLTSSSLCFSWYGINDQIRIPEIRMATASILYVNALSLLDDAIETRLTAGELKDAQVLGRRLQILRDRGDLQDCDALDHLRGRRNEIGHEVGKDATVEELDRACAAIQVQLVAWKLVDDGPPYTLCFERSAMRKSSDPEYAYEHDRIVRVLNGAERVYEAKQTFRFARPGQGKA